MLSSANWRTIQTNRLCWECGELKRRGAVLLRSFWESQYPPNACNVCGEYLDPPTAQVNETPNQR